MVETVTASGTPVEPTNPYVGPQQFDTGHARYYFGRDREARDLLSVVIAHRLVLFYAPSGAGKSSLLRVRLIPGLRSKDVRYLVLPLARVGGTPPENAGPIDNIYAFNVMSSIDGRSDMYPAFSHMTLKQFMRGLRTGDGIAYSYDAGVAAAQVAQEQPETDQTAGKARRSQPPHVLILDQLEEIVTTHATRWPERQQFFEQLNEALEDDPQLWVVLSMRSDYMVEIERFAPELPNYTFVRFAMEHMDKAAAREAVEKPAAKAGRPIDADAVDEILHNLLLVREPGKEDAKASEGPFVQPVQLQVVCYQMWEGLQGDYKPTISVADLRNLAGGDLTRFVDNALGDFYEERLHQALQEVGEGVSQAELRNWFSTKLITTAGTRGFLYKGDFKTEGIPNRVVEFLENKYLLRAESKANSYWYELVHDRFVEPIRASNADWFAKNLSTLQRAAALWIDGGRAAGLLLAGDALSEAERWATAHVEEVSNDERHFLEACRQAQRALERERRDSRRIRLLAVGAAIVAVLAIVAAVFGVTGQQQASTAEQTAVAQAARALNAEATAQANASLAATREAEAVEARQRSDQALGLSLSLTLANQSRDTSSLEDALLLARAATAYSPTLLADTALLDALDDSYPIGDGTMTVYVPHERLDVARGGPWTAIAFSGDGSLLALGDSSGGITLWDNATGGPVGERLVAHGEKPVTALAFDSTGSRLVSTTGDLNDPAARRHELVLWDLADPEAPSHQVLVADQPSFWSAAWSPGGQQLAVANQDGAVHLWNLSGTEPVSHTLPARHADWAYSVAFSPDGSQLASAGKDGRIFLWSDLSSSTPVSQTLTDHTAWVNVVAFSPDGMRLASGSDDFALRLWDLTREPPTSEVLDNHDDAGAEVWDLEFSADGSQLAAGWGDYFVRVYDLEQPGAPWQLAGHTGEVRAVVFDPAAPQRLVSVSSDDIDHAPIEWDLGGRSEFASVQPFTAPVTATLQAMSSGGRWLAVAGDAQTVFVGEGMSSSPAITLTTGMDITAAALSANGNHLALAGCEESLGAAPPAEPSKTPSATKTSDASHPAPVAGARLTGCQLAIWSVDPALPVTRTHTSSFEHSIVAVAFRPQQPDQLAMATEVGDVLTYDLSTPQLTLVYPSRQIPDIVDLAFTSDGRGLAALSNRGLLKVWDWTSRALLEEYSFGFFEDRGFDAVEFLADDAWLALASSTQLELWERGTQQHVETFEVATGRAADLVFDPTADSLTWLQPDGLVRWPMDPTRWLALACTRAGRNLSYDAWRVAFPAAGSDDWSDALVCPDLPLDRGFADALVEEAQNAFAECTEDALATGTERLDTARTLDVSPPLRLDPLDFTLGVLGEQALENLQQPGDLYDAQAEACLRLAAEQLRAAGQPTFETEDAMWAGNQLVWAEDQLADPQTDAGPIVYRLEEIREANAPWPDDTVFNRVQELLPQAYYRLCQQGDSTGCERLVTVVNVMEYGDTVADQYQAGVEEPLYFQGQRGQVVTIAMDAVNNAFDTVVRLEDLNGVLTSDDDSGPDTNSLIANYLLPGDGIYRIVPTAFDDQREGSYRLSLDVSKPRPIALGAVEAATTDQDSLWQFDGQAGQLVAIAMDDADPDFDPYLSLIGPDLTTLAVDGDSGGDLNALIITTLPEDGPYFVKAEGCCHDAAYTLRVFEPRLLPFDQP